MASAQVLLLDDVESLGRQGEILKVKAGYFRNYLSPKGYAVIADKNAVRMQERLKEERAKRAAQDKADAEKTAEALGGTVFTFEVKIDQEGHMYGSVSALDILHRIQEDAGFELEKKAVVLKHPLKQLGVHPVTVHLKEGVTCEVTAKIIAEGVVEEDVEVEASEEAPVEEGGE